MEKSFFIVATILVFLNFGTSVRNLFADHSESHRVGYNLLKLCNVMTWVSTLILFYLDQEDVSSQAWLIGGFIQVLCLGFFLYLKRIAKKRLTIAFCLDLPTKLIKEGPYRWIRHPFYTCYIVSYFTIAVVLGHPITIFNFVFTTAVYIWAAKLEEGKFSKSSLDLDYQKYRTEAGMFWPKLRIHK